jgi:hypothetical protein
MRAISLSSGFLQRQSCWSRTFGHSTRNWGGLTPNQLPLEVVPAPPMNTYQAAFLNLDGDGPQYISSNTLDEVGHATFLNGYLESKRAEPVNLDEFRTLQGSTARTACRPDPPSGSRTRPREGICL